MDLNSTRKLNKELCPAQFVSVIFRQMKKQMEDYAEWSEDEWMLYEFLRENLLLNLTGNYCGCEPCIDLYERLKAHQRSDPLIVNGKGETILKGKEAREFADGKN